MHDDGDAGRDRDCVGGRRGAGRLVIVPKILGPAKYPLVKKRPTTVCYSLCVCVILL